MFSVIFLLSASKHCFESAFGAILIESFSTVFERQTLPPVATVGMPSIPTTARQGRQVLLRYSSGKLS